MDKQNLDPKINAVRSVPTTIEERKPNVGAPKKKPGWGKDDSSSSEDNILDNHLSHRSSSGNGLLDGI